MVILILLMDKSYDFQFSPYLLHSHRHWSFYGQRSSCHSSFSLIHQTLTLSRNTINNPTVNMPRYFKCFLLFPFLCISIIHWYSLLKAYNTLFFLEKTSISFRGHFCSASFILFDAIFIESHVVRRCRVSCPGLFEKCDAPPIGC